MRLRLWLKKIKGFKIRGFHRRRCKNLHRSKPTAHMKNSPVFASGNLSLPTSQQETAGLFPVLPQHVTRRMFAPSPLSPSPSPALTSTPTGHNTPLALKDLLGFEAVDRNKKPPNTFAHIAARLGCCKTESPRMHSSSHGAHEGFAEYGDPNHIDSLKNHKEQGRLQASTTKWTGICKCVLLRMEKQIATTQTNARKLRRTHRASAWNSHMKQQNAMGNEVAKRTDSVQASGSNACRDKEDTSSLLREHVPEKLTTAKLLGGEHASVSTSGHLGARMALSKQTESLANDEIFDDRRGNPCSRNSTSTQSLALSNALPNQQISLVKGGVSTPSSVSSMDKIHNWVPHHSKIAHRGALLVHERTRHQRQVNHSGQLSSDSVDHAIDDAKVRGLGSNEESTLLQADSYDSSETFSISSHSPWLNEPKQVASSNVDLEAHARPWIWTENHVSIPKLHYKSALSRREDAKALKRSYQEVFMQKAVSAASIQSKTNTIVLPGEIIRANQELNSSSLHANHNADKGVRGGMKGSLAVEKRSRDPYIDFMDSMLDMIVQKHMGSSKELEGLLQCFLSLNSLEHHDVIVQAFTEVWEKVVVGKTAELRYVLSHSNMQGEKLISQ